MDTQIPLLPSRKCIRKGDFVDSDLVAAHAWAAQSEINEHPEASILKDEIEQDLSERKLVKHDGVFAAWQIE